MMRYKRWPFHSLLSALLVWAFLSTVAPVAYAQTQQPPSQLEIASRQDGDVILIKVRLNTSVDVDTVWSTMIDYPHAAQFISNLLSSKEEQTDPNTKIVTQIGRVGWEPFAIKMLTVYTVYLNFDHKTIYGKLIRGDVKSMQMESQLSLSPQGSTLLDYSVSIEPISYLPKILVEKILLSHTRQSFSDLLAEIERRAFVKSQGKS